MIELLTYPFHATPNLGIKLAGENDRVTRMATTNNPLARDAETDIDNLEVHQHNVPIVNIEKERDEEDDIERSEVGDNRDRD